MSPEARPLPARCRRRVASWLVLAFPLYLLSTGPVAWATNDGLDPAHLPQGVMVIYLPLASLMRIECFNRLFYWYTAELWGGFPTGYTTL